MQDASRPHDGAPPTTRFDYAAGDGTASDSRSIPELISGALTNLQNIVRSEVQLAKAEMREEAVTAGKGAAMLVAGALIAFYALGLFLLAAVYALGSSLADWLAALIVGLAVAAVAAVLIVVGKSRLRPQARPDYPKRKGGCRMGETTEAIKHRIDDQRHQFEDNLEGIESKVKETQEQVTEKMKKHATDWRAQFQERPMVGLAVAFGGGVLLGTMMSGGGGSSSRSQGFYQYQPQYQSYGDGRTTGSDVGKQHMSSTVDNIKGALMGVAAARAKEFLSESLPGFNEEYRQVEARSDTSGSTTSPSASSPDRDAFAGDTLVS